MPGDPDDRPRPAASAGCGPARRIRLSRRPPLLPALAQLLHLPSRRPRRRHELGPGQRRYRQSEECPLAAVVVPDATRDVPGRPREHGRGGREGLSVHPVSGDRSGRSQRGAGLPAHRWSRRQVLCSWPGGSRRRPCTENASSRTHKSAVPAVIRRRFFTSLESSRCGHATRAGSHRAVSTRPTCVELWRTGPYLHDGSAVTLREVLTTMNPDDQHGRTVPPGPRRDRCSGGIPAVALNYGQVRRSTRKRVGMDNRMMRMSVAREVS